jgi:hypothetical protein
MKKIIGAKDSKKPTGKKPKKSKTETPPQVTLPSLSSVAAAITEVPSETPDEPIDVTDERSFLSQIERQSNFADIKNILNIYANRFDKKGLIKTILDKFNTAEAVRYIIYLFLSQTKLDLEAYYNKFLKEPDERLFFNELLNETDYTEFKRKLVNMKFIFPEYEKALEGLINNYNDEIILKYIIRLYIPQYSLTLEDFYKKFLQYPKEFLVLRELRKLFYKILEDNTVGFESEAEYETVKEQLVLFGNTYPKYNKILNTILTDLDIKNKKFLFKLIKEYMKYTDLTLQEFYDQFKQDTLVKLAISKREPPVVPTIAIEPTIVEPTVIKPNRYFSGIDKTKYVSNSMKDCMYIFSTIPWLKEKVKNIYISKVDTDISDYITSVEITDVDTDLANYMVDGKVLFINDMPWYRTNKKYLELQCSDKYYKVQNGDVLNIYERKTKELFANFRIAFEVEVENSVDEESGEVIDNTGVVGIILQDEELFADEVKFFKNKNKTPLDIIDDILKEQVTEAVKERAFSMLNKVFNGIASKDYIREVVNILAEDSKTVKDLAKRVGNIYIYLYPAGIESISFKTFRKHIELGQYSPEEITKLTYTEKVPEIFGEDSKVDKKTRQEIKGDLRVSFENFIEDFGDEIYIDRNIYSKYKRRSDYRHGGGFRYKIKKQLKDWREDCENFKDYDVIGKMDKILDTINIKKIQFEEAKTSEDRDYDLLRALNNEIKELRYEYSVLSRDVDHKLKKVPIDSLGYYLKYTEDGKTYCLNSEEIYESIQKNILTNPHTGKELEPNFIEKIKKLYKLRKPIEEKPVLQVQNVQVDLAPGLLDLIRLDINRLNELKNAKNTLERYDGCQCKRHYADGQEIDEYDEEPEEGGIDNGNYYQDDYNDLNEDILNEQKDGTEEQPENLEDGTHMLDEQLEDGTHMLDEQLEDGADMLDEQLEDGTHMLDEQPEDGVGILDEDQYENLKEDNDDYTTDTDYDTDTDTDTDTDYYTDDADQINENVVNVTEGEKGKKVCEKCLNQIKGKGFKSIKWDPDNKVPCNVVFCSIKCIEDFHWKKYKYNKRKPKHKSRKSN